MKYPEAEVSRHAERCVRCQLGQRCSEVLRIVDEHARAAAEAAFPIPREVPEA